MTEVLQNSDFRLSISFIDISNNPITLKTFQFDYSTPYSTAVTISYDGQSYINCQPCENGVVATLSAPTFNVGRLKVVRRYTLESPNFADGLLNVEQTEQLNIEIVKQYSENKVSTLTCKVVSMGEHMLFSDAVTVAAIHGQKGEKGEKGESVNGIDYSILELPQKMPNTFALNWAGVKVPVYTYTIVATTASAGNTRLISLAGSAMVLMQAFGSSIAYSTPIFLNQANVVISATNSIKTTVLALKEGVLPPQTEFYITLIYAAA